ncbi:MULTISPECIES: DnaJ family domain-containing protein [Tenebrionibacter/Tenebrionicola group]|jgi:hypothetical protein|uniref:DUF1992 domain-containing protein n=2 Tax=Tenebrionibacter/Tenebrionicola group TaxID=2969848 RepID=A0A8K0Y0U2_9ENTR|nr:MULTISPECIES: DUF1992 domain-containing protein [Tenebrionibacter/Tenebrionicola group]MBK4716974.1 DUF1992 domain-containing protein [Tenebrionibacter intestinalis]MBV5097497.1 DUF1992 domain-containing protein [Tenebrionicola larvae]
MWLIDQWAERHIEEARQRGDFDNLPGAGKPLTLDDDSHVPADLRAGYRLLKNAGYLPPELEARKEALAIVDLLKAVHEKHPDYPVLNKRLTLLELRLKQAGLSTDFLHGKYSIKLIKRMTEG